MHGLVESLFHEGRASAAGVAVSPAHAPLGAGPPPQNRTSVLVVGLLLLLIGLDVDDLDVVAAAAGRDHGRGTGTDLWGAAKQLSLQEPEQVQDTVRTCKTEIDLVVLRFTACSKFSSLLKICWFSLERL